MAIIEIESLSHPGVEVFSQLTETQLRNKLHPEQGIFIAESPKVIKVALDAGYEPTSFLCERKHIGGDAAKLIDRCPDIPVFTGDRSLLAKLTGYTLTRGVLCSMRRKTLPSLEGITRDAHRLAVIDGVCDTTNIGVIFRCAAALGIDAVVLTPTSCDPLNRRAVRVSMGSVFLIPWTFLESPVSELKSFGFKTAALALTDNSILIDNPRLKSTEKLALILGTEGDGLAQEVISQSDFTVKIPMYHGVDSLNVGSAAAIAFWETRFNGGFNPISLF